MTRIRIFNVKVTEFDAQSLPDLHTYLPFADGAVGIGLWVVYGRKGSAFGAQDSVSTSITFKKVTNNKLFLHLSLISNQDFLWWFKNMDIKYFIPPPFSLHKIKQMTQFLVYLHTGAKRSQDRSRSSMITFIISELKEFANLNWNRSKHNLAINIYTCHKSNL